MMDYKSNTSKKGPYKPSRVVMLFSVCIAMSLPFFLVSTFKSKTPLTKKIDKSGSFQTAKQQNISIPTEHGTQQNTRKSYHSKPLTNHAERWEIVFTKQGDSVSSIFHKLGLGAKTVEQVLKSMPDPKFLAQIKPNQRLQFKLCNHQLRQFILPISASESLTISYHDGHYVTKKLLKNVTTHHHYVTATVNHSLYQAAKDSHIPYKLIQQMTDIFKWELDFSKDVRRGDQFTMIYKVLLVDNKQVGVGEIVAVTYKNRGKQHHAILHQKDNGDYDYYDQSGKNLRKAFNRYPVKFSHISSPFSDSRKHPILKKKRPHRGVDLAAPIGTPIRAVGDGTVVSIGPQSGYGNVIKLNHHNVYKTVYAHMLKFKRGLSRGAHVKRGDIIGYVGQSGLATGPHCHYEFHVNKKPKNPSTVKLPNAQPIPKSELGIYQATAQSLLAQLTLFEEAHFAALDDTRAHSSIA